MGGAQSLKHTLISNHGFPVDKYDYRWTVSHVQNILSWGAGSSTCTSVDTSHVKEDADKFKLFFYPNGFNRNVKGYTSLFLQKVSSKEILVIFCCHIVFANGKKSLEKSIKQKLGTESLIGFLNFLPRSALVRNNSNILKNGNLTLEFSIHIFHEKALTNPENEACENTVLMDLSDNFMNLLLDEEYHDFEIHVQDKKFAVHKNILGARSPVLRAMLKSPLTNSKSMTITDISEPIIKEMLGFIYSGQVRHLDFQEASELYYAADKYEINYLKVVCFNIIKNNVKIANVLNTLLLSERHSDSELREICIEYVVKNAPKVQKLPEWIEFLKSQPELANVVFKRLVSKKE